MNIVNKYKKYRYYVITLFLMFSAFSIPFGEDYIRPIISITFFIWLIFFGFKNIVTIMKNSKFLISLTSLVLLYYLSLLWSEDINSGIQYVQRIMIYVYLPILIFTTSVDKKNIYFVMSSFIGAMFINEIISYLIYFDLYQTTYSLKNHYPVGFINHIPYSVLVAFTAILILFQSKYMSNKYIKVVYIIFFITMTTNLVISGGRTGYVAYFGTLVILLFTYYKLTIKNFLYILVFPIVIFSIGYNLNSEVRARIEATFTDVNKISKNQNFNTSFGTRLAAYPIVWNFLKNDNFLFGSGVGNLGKIKNKVIYDNHMEKNIKGALQHPHLHNFYADTILMIGILGLVLLVLSLYFLWKLKIIDKEYRFLQQLIVIIIVSSCFADRMLHTKETMLFFAIFASLIVAQNRIENESSSDK